MIKDINYKKISWYIVIAFAFSWLLAGLQYFLGLSSNYIAKLLFGVAIMWGPALATIIVQKKIYKDKLKQYGWAFDFKQMKWYLYTILLFILFIFLFGLIIFVLGNTHLISEFGRIDFSSDSFISQYKNIISKMTNLKLDNGAEEALETQLRIIPTPLYLLIFIVQGIIAGSTVNVLATFGEEFGWRGLLLKETQVLGFIKSSLFIGVIWGIWHTPLILMGLNYPNYPILGLIMMVLFTVSLSPLHIYVRLKTKSILAPSMLHGMINATGANLSLFIADANELVGTLAGVSGVLSGCLITLGICIFDKKFVSDFK